MAKLTLKLLEDGPVFVIVNTSVSASVPVASLIANEGGVATLSLSVIVPVAVAVAMVAPPVAPVRLTIIISVLSATESSIVGTKTVSAGVPAGKVIVPGPAV